MSNSYVLYKKQLEGTYQTTVNKIEVYVNANNLDPVSKEELMNSLLDTFLSAQKDNRPVEKITGNNLERFCREFCSGFGFKENLLSFFEYMIPMIIMIFFMSLLGMMNIIEKIGRGEHLNPFTYVDKSQNNIEIISLFIGLTVATLIDYFANRLIKKWMFKYEKVTMSFAVAVHIAVIGIILIALIIPTIFFDEFLASVEVPEIIAPVGFVFCVTLILIVLYALIIRKRHKENIDTGSDIFSSYFAEKELENIQKYETERRKKLNDKRAKKGQKPLTDEEFLNGEILDCKKSLNPLFFIILPIAASEIMGLLQYFSLSEDEPVIDAVLLALLILIVGALISRLFYTNEKRFTQKRMSWIEKQQEKS